MDQEVTIFQSVLANLLESFSPSFAQIIGEYENLTSNPNENKNQKLITLFKHFPREVSSYLNIVNDLTEIASCNPTGTLRYIGKLIKDTLAGNLISNVQMANPVYDAGNKEHQLIYFYFSLLLLSDITCQIAANYKVRRAGDFLIRIGHAVTISLNDPNLSQIDDMVIDQWAVILSLISEIACEPVTTMFTEFVDIEKAFQLLKYVRLDYNDDHSKKFMNIVINEVYKLNKKKALTPKILDSVSYMLVSCPYNEEILGRAFDIVYSKKEEKKNTLKSEESILLCLIILQRYQKKKNLLNQFVEKKVFSCVNNEETLLTALKCLRLYIFGKNIDPTWYFWEWGPNPKVNDLVYVKWNSFNELNVSDENHFTTIFMKYYFPYITYKINAEEMKQLSCIILHLASFNFQSFILDVVPAFLELNETDSRFIAFISIIKRLNSESFIQYAFKSITSIQKQSFNMSIRPKILKVLENYKDDEVDAVPFESSEFLTLVHIDECDRQIQELVEYWKLDSTIGSINMTLTPTEYVSENKSLSSNSIINQRVVTTFSDVFQDEDYENPEIFKILVKMSYDHNRSVSTAAFSLCKEISKSSITNKMALITLVDLLKIVNQSNDSKEIRISKELSSHPKDQDIPNSNNDLDSNNSKKKSRKKSKKSHSHSKNIKLLSPEAKYVIISLILHALNYVNSKEILTNSNNELGHSNLFIQIESEAFICVSSVYPLLRHVSFLILKKINQLLNNKGLLYFLASNMNSIEQDVKIRLLAHTEPMFNNSKNSTEKNTSYRTLSVISQNSKDNLINSTDLLSKLVKTKIDSNISEPKDINARSSNIRFKTLEGLSSKKNISLTTRSKSETSDVAGSTANEAAALIRVANHFNSDQLKRVPNSYYKIKFETVLASHYYDIWLLFIQEMINVMIEINYTPFLNKLYEEREIAMKVLIETPSPSSLGQIIIYSSSVFNLATLRKFKQLNKIPYLPFTASNNKSSSNGDARSVLKSITKKWMKSDDQWKNEIAIKIIEYSHFSTFPKLITAITSNSTPPSLTMLSLILSTIVVVLRSPDITDKYVQYNIKKIVGIISTARYGIIKSKLNGTRIIEWDEASELETFRQSTMIVNFCILCEIVLTHGPSTFPEGLWPQELRHVTARFFHNWVRTTSLNLERVRTASKRALCAILKIGPIFTDSLLFDEKCIDLFGRMCMDGYVVLGPLLSFHFEELLKNFIEAFFFEKYPISEYFFNSIIDNLTENHSHYSSLLSGPLLLLGLVSSHIQFQNWKEFLIRFLRTVGPINQIENIETLIDSMTDTPPSELLPVYFKYATEAVFSFFFHIIKHQSLKIPMKDIVASVLPWVRYIRLLPAQTTCALGVTTMFAFFTPYQFLTSLMEATETVKDYQFSSMALIWSELIKIPDHKDLVPVFISSWKNANIKQALYMILINTHPIEMTKRIINYFSFAYYYHITKGQKSDFDEELWICPLILKEIKNNFSELDETNLPKLLHFSLLFRDKLPSLFEMICNEMNIEYPDSSLKITQIPDTIRSFAYSIKHSGEKYLEEWCNEALKWTFGSDNLVFSASSFFIHSKIIREIPSMASNVVDLSFLNTLIRVVAFHVSPNMNMNNIIKHSNHYSTNLANNNTIKLVKASELSDKPKDSNGSDSNSSSHSSFDEQFGDNKTANSAPIKVLSTPSFSATRTLSDSENETIKKNINDSNRNDNKDENKEFYMTLLVTEAIDMFRQNYNISPQLAFSFCSCFIDCRPFVLGDSLVNSLPIFRAALNDPDMMPMVKIAAISIIRPTITRLETSQLCRHQLSEFAKIMKSDEMLMITVPLKLSNQTFFTDLVSSNLILEHASISALCKSLVHYALMIRTASPSLLNCIFSTAAFVVNKVVDDNNNGPLAKIYAKALTNITKCPNAVSLIKTIARKQSSVVNIDIIDVYEWDRSLLDVSRNLHIVVQKNDHSNSKPVITITDVPSFQVVEKFLFCDVPPKILPFESDRELLLNLFNVTKPKTSRKAFLVPKTNGKMGLIRTLFKPFDSSTENTTNNSSSDGSWEALSHPDKIILEDIPFEIGESFAKAKSVTMLEFLNADKVLNITMPPGIQLKLRRGNNDIEEIPRIQ